MSRAFPPSHGASAINGGSTDEGPIAVLLVLALAQPLRAQRACRGASTLVYADSVSFFLDAPPGWILDCEAGRAQGPLTVLFRTGESWQTGPAVMYASVTTDTAKRPRAFAQRVKDEAADWRQGVPDATVTERPSIKLKDGTVVLVQQFYSKADQLFEIVAYFPRGRIMPMLTLTGRTQQAFDQALPAFTQLVRSYAVGPVVKKP